MRIAIFSDIHANFPALSAALKSTTRYGVEKVFVAGDLVDRGPHPVEVLRYLNKQNIPAIKGNVENKLLKLRNNPKRTSKMLKKKSAHLAWTALQLQKSEWAYLESLPGNLDFELCSKRILLVHGSPLSDEDYIYPSITNTGLKAKLKDLKPDILICGHTHIPFLKAFGSLRLINCGAVGLAIDGDPRGSYALLEILNNKQIHGHIVRFNYSIKRVVSDLELRAVPAVAKISYEQGVSI